MITINAIGDACPIPVVKTRNAIRDQNGAALQTETFVDNEIAVQNLTKMAEQKGYKVHSERLGPQKFRVVMDVPALQNASPASETSAAPMKNGAKDNPSPDMASGSNAVIVISSTQMGTGSEELGAALLKSFLYALSQTEPLPRAMLFYNSGVRNTTEGSPFLEDLSNLEQRGVEILSCGTCLNYYGLTEKLRVGAVTNMYDIVERQMRASKVIQP